MSGAKFGANPWDWADLAKRLLALGQIGCHIRGADGHFWIECGAPDRETSYLAWKLKEAGILLNNKIYGGVLEALDTIDAALVAAGDFESLKESGDYLIEDQLDLGSHRVDSSSIDRVDPGCGGIV